MKAICSIKINNSVVFTNFLEGEMSKMGYDTDGVRPQDFTFSPWLIAYRDGEWRMTNFNEGFYQKVKADPEFDVREFVYVKDFMDAAAVMKEGTVQKPLF